MKQIQRSKQYVVLNDWLDALETRGLVLLKSKMQHIGKNGREGYDYISFGDLDELLDALDKVAAEGTGDGDAVAV